MKNGIAIVKLWRTVLLKLTSAYGRWVLWINGVQVGKDVLIGCAPQISRSPGARIALHDSVKLSGSLSNRICGCAVMGLSAERGAEIVVGSNTGISCSILYAKRSIRIGKNVNIGAGCMIVDSDFHPLDVIERRLHRVEKIECGPVVIEEDAWLGANVMVLKGVTIGRGSVIAAGAVVSNSIPAGVIAAGVPARVIKTLEQK